MEKDSFYIGNDVRMADPAYGTKTVTIGGLAPREQYNRIHTISITLGKRKGGNFHGSVTYGGETHEVPNDLLALALGHFIFCFLYEIVIFKNSAINRWQIFGWDGKTWRTYKTIADATEHNIMAITYRHTFLGSNPLRDLISIKPKPGWWEIMNQRGGITQKMTRSLKFSPTTKIITIDPTKDIQREFFNRYLQLIYPNINFNYPTPEELYNAKLPNP